jgi:hypothetical protein
LQRRLYIFGLRKNEEYLGQQLSAFTKRPRIMELMCFEDCCFKSGPS